MQSAIQHRLSVASSDGPPKLSWGSLWLCLSVSLSLFFFLGGPVWRHTWDIDDVSHRILISYAVIPLSVAICLLFEGKLRLASLFLDSLKLVGIKFFLTLMTMHTLWLVSATVPPAIGAGAQPMDANPVEVEAPAEPEARAPTAIDPDQAGAVRVTVVDRAGRPIAGALVRIHRGLEGYVFARPDGAVVVTNDGSGYSPPLAVVQANQPIRFYSRDGLLHTAKGTAVADGRPVFNYAVPAESHGREVTIRRPVGVVDLDCRVHPGEARAQLVIVDNPFFAFTGADGAVELGGVPAGSIGLHVLSRDGERELREVEIAPGTKIGARIEF